VGLTLPIGVARQYNSLSLSQAGLKAGCRIGMTAVLLQMGAGSVHDAAALNETRTLSFHHTHSGEDLTVTFKRDGRYDEEALKQLNHFLRDWRTQDETVMDRHLFDIIWEAYRDVDGKQPIQIISCYRSPATNAMLRHRSANSGVARFSQHMLGHAMDFYIPGVPLEQIRYAGLRLQRGGVGFYPTSGSPFVHLDTGSIRYWPRMTHDQLAKVFPDGRTVHIPSDGVPLKGYELARADIEKRGDGSDAAPAGKLGFLAALFKGKSNDEDDEGAAAAVVEKKPQTAAVAAAKPADIVPKPRAKPQIAASLQLASADAQDVLPPKLKQAGASEAPNAQTAADIINARGFWDGSATPQQATPAQAVAATAARQAIDSADPQTTSTVTTAYRAMAYAQASSSPADRSNVVASAPAPRVANPVTPRSVASASETNSIVSGEPRRQDEPFTNATRLSASRNDGLWMRIMMLAPNASAMSVTMMGDIDLSTMRVFFVKPQSAIVMTFNDDPMMGMTSDSFSGSAVVRLETTPFVQRTALLH
jgi:uncharacterized protein YcbK (DUF882 family)